MNIVNCIVNFLAFYTYNWIYINMYSYEIANKPLLYSTVITFASYRRLV